jgi:superfamily II DNA or RNA helicase
MSINLEELRKASLRKCQDKALTMIDKYLKSEETIPALVKMPTGSGKTGLIAISSQINDDVVLILAPNASLPIQMKNEIQTDFWNKICYTGSSLKKVALIKESKDINSCKFSETPILVMTVQLLLSISKSASYDNLVKNVNLIIFDEGHHEPAKYWSTVINGFCCKKIFFTATPYRNDNLIFKINEVYVYRYYTDDAIKQGDILNPTFDCIASYILENDYDLAKWLLEIKDTTDSKILVRISNPLRIEKLVTILNQEAICAVGFHSTLPKSTNIYNEGKDIYDLEETFKIILHEDMFVEGLDLKGLETLVIVDCFQNAKSFIQQVGRILRIESQKKSPKVYLNETECSFWENQWKVYCKYDTEKNVLDIKYIKNFFRKKWDIYRNEINADNIRIPKRATIFGGKKSFYNKTKSLIKDRIVRRLDLEEWPTFEDDRFWIVYYEKEAPTNFLNNSFYHNKSLEFSCIYERKINKQYYLFYADSIGLSIPDVDDELKRIPATELHKLLDNQADVRNIRMKTTLARNGGINSRNIAGHNLENIPQSLLDRLSYLSSVTAIQNKTRRLINPSNARISDDENVSYFEYIKWCNQMANSITAGKKNNKFFDKHSYPVDPINDSPTSICLYLNTCIENCTNKYTADFDSIYCKIDTTTNSFCISIETKSCICRLDKLGSDIITVLSDDLDDYQVYSSGENLLDYINSGNYTLFYNSKQIAYISGTYYFTNIRTRYNPPLLWNTWENIIGINTLSNCEDEKLKGINPRNNREWPTKSIFRSIMDEIHDNKKEIDYLLCSDLQTEISDFIGISTSEKKIYFIHCKYGDSKLSASALQDVYGQASKNSHYLFMNDIELLEYLKNKYTQWETNWVVSKSIKDKVTGKKSKQTYSKIRLAVAPTGKNIKNFEKELEDLLSNEQEDARRELWIVTSGLSKESLEKELIKDKSKRQSEEFHQFMWFTQNIQDTFSALNVRMKIFCKE